MKSAYELAMERLEKAQPTVKLSDEQRDAIAEIQNRYEAKIAEKRVFLQDQIKQARREGDYDKVEIIERETALELNRLEQECEEQKEKIRQTN